MTSALGFTSHSMQLLSLFQDPTLTALTNGAETHKTALAKRRETTLKTTGLVHSLLTQTIENFKKAGAELDRQIAKLRAQNELTKGTQNREITILRGDLSKAEHTSSPATVLAFEGLTHKHLLLFYSLQAIGLDCANTRAGILDGVSLMFKITPWSEATDLFDYMRRPPPENMEDFPKWCKETSFRNLLPTRDFKSPYYEPEAEKLFSSVVLRALDLNNFPRLRNNPLFVAMLISADFQGEFDIRDVANRKFKGYLAAPELAFKAIEEQYPGIL